MKSILEQLKKRRISLDLKQHDMLLRAGISRQQYQQIESRGNPRLDTLELIAKGLKCELMLIPQEKINVINTILESDNLSPPMVKIIEQSEENELANDPWESILKDDD